MFRILLVDDEAQERDGIRFLIEKYRLPLSVVEAQNGQKALEYLKGHPVDILFTDVKMPYKDGLELAKETFQFNPDIRIIIFSAYGEFEYAKRAMEANAVDYLLKPIELDEFEKVMNKVIGDLERQREESKQEQEQKEASMKRVFYKVFTGGSVSASDLGMLEEYFRTIGKDRKVLISLESGRNIFEQQEEVFLKLLHTYIRIPCEYVNLYPDSSVVLVADENRIVGSGLQKQLEKLARDGRQLLGTEISIVVSREFTTVEEMNRQMEEISQIRKNFYGTGGEITFLSEIVLNSEYYAAEVERIKELMIGAIGDRNDDLVILYGDQLVETMVGGHVVSRIYVHHVFYDILSAFYSQYGVNDKPRLFESVERLLSYKDGEELEVNFRAVLNEVLAKRTDAAGDSPRIVERIKNIVRDEYRSDIGLEDIAERVNLAPAYLSYLFKKETGANLVKYITDYRMEQARKLLEDEELKIVLVAKACGYENQPYFNRLFKNYYGMTPRQYREKNGKQQG